MRRAVPFTHALLAAFVLESRIHRWWLTPVVADGVVEELLQLLAAGPGPKLTLPEFGGMSASKG